MKRVLGLDTLRIFSLMLITWQHVATVLGAYYETQWHYITPGQIGTATFCAVAGYLACSTQASSPLFWLKRRLLVIFPAYWIALLVGYVMMMIMPTKPITWGLFISQLFGMGYFTHGWELVNVVTWFVSLILLCYGLVVIALSSQRPIVFWLLVCVVCAVLIATRLEVALSRHILAFALGGLIAGTRGNLSKPQSSYLWLAVGFALLLIGVTIDHQFFYAGFAALALMTALRGLIWEGKWANKVSRYTYEYFLVHGMCLNAVYELSKHAQWSIPLALVLALIASVILHQVQKPVARLLGQLLNMPEKAAQA